MQAGESFAYTLTVMNLGSLEANNVIITDDLSEELSLISASESCTASGQTVTCVLGNVSADESKTVSIKVKAPTSAQSVSNTATVSTSTQENVSEDNSSSVTTTISAADGVKEADLELSKSAAQHVQVGKQFSYLLTITNRGPSSANSVIVTDDLPANLSYLSDTANCQKIDQSLRCDIGMLIVGETREMMISVVAPATPETLTNVASVSSAVTDPDSGNDVDSAETLVTEDIVLLPGLAFGLGSQAVTSPTATLGDSDVAVMQVAVTASEAEDVELKTVTLKASGSGHDAVDLSSVKLYQDTNGDAQVGSEDFLLSSEQFTEDNGTLTLSMATPFKLNAGTQETLLIAVDVSSTLAMHFKITLTFAGLLAVFGLVLRGNYKHLSLLLLIALLATGCNTQKPPPANVQTSSYQFTLSSAAAHSLGSQSVANTSGLPLKSSTLTVNK